MEMFPNDTLMVASTNESALRFNGFLGECDDWEQCFRVPWENSLYLGKGLHFSFCKE